MAPQKMVRGRSHQLMAQKMVQVLIPRRESLLIKGINKLQRDFSYPSSFNSKQSNLTQAVRYMLDPFLVFFFFFAF